MGLYCCVSVKEGWSLHFCINYCKLNSIACKDAYPIPRIDDILDTIAGSTRFTTLDLVSGYWEVEVLDKDREKTAFCTQEGIFEFKVMPFGLCNAQATCQRLIDLVLARVKWSACLVYLDDIVLLVRPSTNTWQMCGMCWTPGWAVSETRKMCFPPGQGQLPGVYCI